MFVSVAFIGTEINGSEIRKACHIRVSGGTGAYINNLLLQWREVGLVTLNIQGGNFKGKHGGARYKQYVATKVASKDWSKDDKEAITTLLHTYDVPVNQWDRSMGINTEKNDNANTSDAKTTTTDTKSKCDTDDSDDESSMFAFVLLVCVKLCLSLLYLFLGVCFACVCEIMPEFIIPIFRRLFCFDMFLHR